MNRNQSWTLLKIIVGVVLVTSITVWTYQESTNNQLVWDSYHYLIKNVWYISKLSIDNTIWMFLSLDPYWHPLTWLSWAIDYQVYGGLDSSGYHLTNNILHAINSALVFLLTLVVFGLNGTEAKGYPFRADNHALIAAFITSLLFAVHPQHVESVAWVAERKDVLCQLFLMLSMFTYVKYAACQGKAKSYWFYGTLGLFGLALLSKPMAVTFPVVLLLIDVYPLRRTRFIQPGMHSIKQQPLYKLLREKLAFFLLSVLLVLITLLAHVDTVSSISLHLRLLNACNSILLYLTKLLVPLNFAPLYSYFIEPGETMTWTAFLPIFGVLGLTIASVYAWTRGRYEWLIAWLIYLVTLAPVLGLVQSGEQGAADRFAYLPTLPAYILVGAGILIVLDKSTHIRKVLVLLTFLFLALLLGVKTKQQIHIWKDSHSLWSYAVKSNPTNVTARYNLGISFLRQQDYKNAAIHFDKSLNLPSNPTSAVMAFPTLAFRGLTYIYLGRFDEALKDYLSLGEALTSSPDLNLDHDCVYFNTGWLYAQSGLMEEARMGFGLVDFNSQLWSDSETWLKNIGQLEENQTPNQVLPDFCTSVFPTEVINVMSAPDRTNN
jgi:tetratricopeptide (TPR) repeat protein